MMVCTGEAEIADMGDEPEKNSRIDMYHDGEKVTLITHRSVTPRPPFFFLFVVLVPLAQPLIVILVVAVTSVSSLLCIPVAFWRLKGWPVRRAAGSLRYDNLIWLQQ